MNRLFTAFIVGAMVLGVLVGWGVNQGLSPEQAKAVAENLTIITDVFLRLIKMIIAPLVFSTLVAGIAHMEDAASIGRVGVKTMLWFISASIVSLMIGLFADARYFGATNMSGLFYGGGLTLLAGLVYALWARGAPLHGAARFASERELKRHGFRSAAGIVRDVDDAGVWVEF